MKGDNGELLVCEEQVSDKWREYFEKLLNEEELPWPSGYEL